MSGSATLEGEAIEGDAGVGNQPKAPSIDISPTPLPEGLRVEPATNLPTRVAEGEGVVTNQDEALVGEVAEGGA